MEKKLQFLLISLILFMQQRPLLGNYAADCTTPSNEKGKCMPIKSCAKIYSTLLSVQKSGMGTSENDVALLRESQCDYQNKTPFVCCPIGEIQRNADIYSELTKQECGQHQMARIANGDIAEIYNYRWMALLKFDSESVFQCGASLINHRYLLTAAHCIVSPSGFPKAVRLGEYDLNTEIDCITKRTGKHCLPPHEDIDIEKIFYPDEYKSGDIYHDIALIRLVRPVEFGENIKPICLPITKELQELPITLYLVAGWGRTEDSNQSNVLRYVAIPGQTREFCSRKLHLGSKRELNEDHICAGGENQKDSCKGDSGSPLFSTQLYLDGIVRAIQYGVVSFGVRSCGDVSLPAVYTNVTHYMQWITDHMSLE